MESQFFTWTTWDQADLMVFLFSGCELLVDVGEYPAGTKVATIRMAYDKGVMNFYGGRNADKIIASFNLFLRAEKADG